METDADKVDDSLDPVEEASQESFPASDPPAWAMGEGSHAIPAEVSNNEAANRFELHLGGGEMAFLTYRRAPREIVFTHTEVPAELQGRGLGSKVVRAALNFSREHGLKVIPLCPFVRSYIRQHQAYVDLIRTE